ncbi:hypothetical protein MP228_003682 [Amoeboaphelidium protococcarum]|nr:hypothetical protein MP228_003682 [Amoeboaphelidium protococcarum]
MSSVPPVSQSDRKSILLQMVQRLQQHFGQTLPLDNIMKVAQKIEQDAFSQCGLVKQQYLKQITDKISSIVQRATQKLSSVQQPSNVNGNSLGSSSNGGGVGTTAAPDLAMSNSIQNKSQFMPSQTQIYNNQSSQQQQQASQPQPQTPIVQTPLIDLNLVKLELNQSGQQSVTLSDGSKLKVQIGLPANEQTLIQSKLRPLRDSLLKWQKIYQKSQMEPSFLHGCAVNVDKLQKIWVVMAHQLELIPASIYIVNAVLLDKLVQSYELLYGEAEKFVKDLLLKKQQQRKSSNVSTATSQSSASSSRTLSQMQQQQQQMQQQQIQSHVMNNQAPRQLDQSSVNGSVSTAESQIKSIPSIKRSREDDLNQNAVDVDVQKQKRMNLGVDGRANTNYQASIQQQNPLLSTQQPVVSSSNSSADVVPPTQELNQVIDKDSDKSFHNNDILSISDQKKVVSRQKNLQLSQKQQSYLVIEETDELFQFDTKTDYLSQIPFETLIAVLTKQ